MKGSHRDSNYQRSTNRKVNESINGVKTTVTLWNEGDYQPENGFEANRC